MTHLKRFFTLLSNCKKITVFLVVIYGLNTYAQNINVITGIVKDNLGVTMPGVNVLNKSKGTGGITDIDGRFTLQGVFPGDTIEFSFVGYLKEIQIAGDKSIIDIFLTPELLKLGEVTVIGYGTQKKSDLTSAITTVDAKKLTNLPVVGIDNALSGKAAGVQVTPSSGAPGSKTVVRVRGMGSANNPDPIFVVDGIIMGSNVDFLSPSDIESMEVLKDASATAIYGSQGAGGVIIVNTKKGVTGKSNISFDAYVGMQETWRKLDVMNAAQFAKMQNAVAFANDDEPVFPDPDTNYSAFKALYPHDTDWQDQVFRKAPVSSYTLSYTGGNEKATVLVSGSYFNQDGIVKTSSFERMSLRVNTTVKPFKNVTLGENISYGHYNRSRIFENQEVLSPIIKAIRYDPMQPVSDANLFPNTTNNYSYSPRVIENNPMATLDFRKEKFITNQLFGNIYANVNLLKYFNFNSTLGAAINNGGSTLYGPQFFITANYLNPTPQYREGLSENTNWQWFNTLTFSKVIFEKHDVSLMVGTEASAGKSKSISTGGSLLYDSPATRFISPNLDATTVSVNGEVSDFASYSYISRLLYSYSEKYMLTFSFRRDASSKFAAKYRQGNFPAGSIGWKFSSESFMSGLEFLSLGKLRYGFGVVGGQNVGNSQWESTIDLHHRYGYVSGEQQTFQQGGVPARVPNEKAIWENNISHNYGLDLAFFNYKLTLTADYFKKRNDGMLVKVPLPSLAGLYQANAPWEGEISYPLVNAGVVENVGYEIALGYKNYDRVFKYSFDVNYSHYDNKLISIARGQDFQAASVHGFGYVSVGKEGYPLGAFWGYETNGLFREEDTEMIKGNKVVTNQPQAFNPKRNRYEYMQDKAQPGDLRFVDQDDNGILDERDMKMIGNPHPDFSFGLNADFMYKEFDLSIALQGVYGNDIFNSMKRALYNNDGSYNWSLDMANYYRSPVIDDDGNTVDPGNTNTDVPGINPRYNSLNQISDFYVEDGSFIRIKNIQLGYSINDNIIKKLNISRMRVYMSVYNLYTFTKYSGLDPEIGQGESSVLDIGVDRGSYPQARSFSIGVNLVF